MEMIDVSKGLTQNRILGEYATFYAASNQCDIVERAFCYIRLTFE